MQERQFPPFDSEKLAPAERQVLRRTRVRRLQGLAFCVGAGVLALFAVGCPEPADLQNPSAYPPPAGAGGTGTTGGTGTGGSGTASCEIECVNKLFQKDMMPCLFCHTKDLKLGDLDLQSPGYTARLKDMPAQHTGFTTPKTDCPPAAKLIDTANPANSWLLKKIHNEQKTCGSVMPQAGTLTADQMKCLETYVACVAPGGGTTTGGAATGGAATGGATGSGGAATGGGGAAAAGTGSGGGGASAGGSSGTGGA